MSKKREILLIGFKIFLIILFLITAPLIVLWAGGYRFNFKNKKIQKVGLVILESSPKANLNIYFDGTLQKRKKTPIKFELLPGEYHFKIEKDKFWPWEKELEVKESEITWQDFIILFPKELEKEIIEEDIAEFQIAEESQEIIYIKNKELYLRDKRGNKYILYSGINPHDIQLSADGKRIIIQEGKKNKYFLIIDLVNIEKPNIIKYPKIQFKKILYKPNDSSLIFALDKNQNLFAINLNRNSNPLLFTNGVLDFALTRDKIYLLRKNSPNILEESNYNLANKREIIKTQKTNFQIKENLQNSLKALLIGEELFYLNENVEKISDEVKNIHWDKKGEKLLFANNYEIKVFYLKKNYQNVKLTETVTRLSQKISHPIFYSDSEHILFCAEGKLKVIELDGKNNIELLNQGSDCSNLFLNDKNYLYLKQQKNLLILKLPRPESNLPFINLFLP